MALTSPSKRFADPSGEAGNRLEGSTRSLEKVAAATPKRGTKNRVVGASSLEDARGSSQRLDDDGEDDYLSDGTAAEDDGFEGSVVSGVTDRSARKRRPLNSPPYQFNPLTPGVVVESFQVRIHVLGRTARQHGGDRRGRRQDRRGHGRPGDAEEEGNEVARHVEQLGAFHVQGVQEGQVAMPERHPAVSEAQSVALPLWGNIPDEEEQGQIPPAVRKSAFFCLHVCSPHSRFLTLDDHVGHSL